MRVRPIVQQPLRNEHESAVTLISAHLLIPGRGEPIPRGGLAFCGSKIAWVGSFSSRPDKYRNLPFTTVPVLMPGLWDCHVHFLGIDVAASVTSGIVDFLPGAPALAGAVVADDLRRTLAAGYTSVRELGGYGADVWPGIESGALVGPNVYSSVGALSITGGHGDMQMMPLGTVEAAMEHGSAPLAVCDGVDECVKTVRKMIRRGARVIKVCSSGGVLSLHDDPEDCQFSDQELKAIVDEAARSRRVVASHAIGKAGIMAALRAGVKSIEHGMYIDEETADAMVAAGAIYVPTQHIIRVITTDYRHKIPLSSLEKALALVQQSKVAYKIALRKGVKFALGTDVGSSDPRSKLSHGHSAHELVYAVELGMTPRQAIESATANGPETLGGMAPLSGQLREGYDADIIAVSANPLDDVSVLTNPSNVTHVWKGGKLFKQPSS
ncbi:amidohydrolase [Metarhizium album ARSEF 1941]|uniref:Amidohydrolase n=1 Tax=Metarhizium album (strain ARSEF 1941) TaxID=1081103 RepID=A0A0B2X826_METAS|nr:amidohydrolase [Metarhizium album ARSEF 1941]KHO01451.1 amidohydrolase [Metarhizium album ARSEF 1941]